MAASDPLPSPCSSGLTDEYYRYLVECSRFAIIGTDCGGQITSWNTAAKQIFHQPAEQVVGLNIESIVPEHLKPTLKRHMDQALTARQSTEFELDTQDEDGGVKFLAMVISPVLDQDQRLIGLAAWIRDITNRKSLEKQLNHAEKIASLGTLAAGVAHHFNNIFGGVATFVDFALDSNDPQAIQRALQITVDAASRVGNITRSLLTYAEKDAHSIDMSDLTEVVLTFTHLTESSLNAKHISLNLHMHAIPIVEVPGTRMHQVLGNLLDNAEQAMPEGGAINMSLEQQDNDVVLSFSDTGYGIDPKHLPHIFEPFYTTRGVSGGGDHPAAGLGLSVVQGIIRELGGRIEVESAKGQGATFRLRFPIKLSSKPK